MVLNDGTSDVFAQCERYGISDVVKDDLEALVGHLDVWKKEILPSTQTITKRAESFQKIEAIAATLANAIAELSFIDRATLDCEFFGFDESGFPAVNEMVQNSLVFDLGGHLIPMIEESAKTVRGRFEGVGTGGRQPITERQADFIRCIAQKLKPANIVPSHSGPFLDLCTAVFQDAGITLPARSLRYFMKSVRPGLKALGYCL